MTANPFNSIRDFGTLKLGRVFKDFLKISHNWKDVLGFLQNRVRDFSIESPLAKKSINNFTSCCINLCNVSVVFPSRCRKI